MEGLHLSTATRLGVLSLGLGIIGWQCNEKGNLTQFELHPDFAMELIASEPQVFDPVDLEFDHHGDAYVLQMPGYPRGEDQSSIIKLIDADADGIYESSQIFATDLMQASSILPYQDGFLVAAPPDLLFLKDNDGDGLADERRAIMSGFTDANLQHNFNGLTYGIDHWIYLANGGNGGSAYWSDRADSILRIGASDFKIDLDKHRFELVGRSSGGFELAMDDWGHFFGTHNMYHIRNIVFPSYYIGDFPLNPRDLLIDISDHEEKGLGRIYPIGEQETRVNHPEQSGYFSGACGITHYGGSLFPPEFQGNIFVNDVVLNLVHRDIVGKNGSVFSASRGRQGVDFLASPDRSFRPVNSTVGPDGALYIVDMYRKVIEHPEWIPDELEVNMDIDAGKDKGRIYRIRPTGAELMSAGLSEVSTEKLVDLLSHESQWHRMTAQRLLLQYRDPATAEILKKAWNADQPARTQMHLLYTLNALGEDIGQQLLGALKRQEDAKLQEHLLMLSEIYIGSNDDILNEVLAMSQSSDPRIKMQVALTLSTLPERRQREFEDQFITALINISEDGGLDDRFVATALSIAARYLPITFLKTLRSRNSFTDSKYFHHLVELIASGVARSENQNQQLALVKEFAQRQSDKKLILNIVMAYANASIEVLEPSAKSSWKSILNQLENTGDLELTAACWELRNSLKIPAGPNAKMLIAEAQNRLRTGQVPADEVVSLTKLLAHGDPALISDDLINLVDAKQPIEVQQVAINILDGFRDTTLVAKLIDSWPGLAPATRRRVTDMLIYDPGNHDLLFNSLENGILNIAEFNFDLERRRRLLNSKDESTANRAKKLFSDAGVVKRQDAIDAMREVIDDQGNPDRGLKVFRAQCASCHKFGNVGVNVGPDLSEISRKSKETLLHDILDPNAGADPEFINHIVETENGSVISGILSNETDATITLIMMGGEEKTVSKSQIKSLQSTGLSLMPEGLEGVISKGEMADLLAFLQRPIL
ncbi:MAG: c-type cytochrome [Saprospiraceae bacterium]|nr:c-type cytochrome [Saprospiraceae bacterium]